MRKAVWRVGLMASVLSLSSLFWVGFRARAALDRLGLGLGRGLLEAVLSENPPSSSMESHLFTVNGVAVRVETAILGRNEDRDEDLLFSRAHASCHEVYRPVQSLTRPSRPAGPGGERLVQAPLIEDRGERESFLYCLRPRVPGDQDGWADALSRFLRTGDLEELGHFQGIYLRKGDSSSVLLTVEIEGEFRAGAMFPDEEDCPGSDIEALPRPVGRRFFSILRGRTPILASYRARGDPNAVLERFVAKLKDAGWANLHPRSLPGNERSVFLVSRDEDRYLVSVQKAPDDSNQADLFVLAMP